MLMYTRHRGVCRFFCVFTLAFFLPVSVEYWHIVDAVAWAGEQPQASSPAPLSLLNPEMLKVFTGGPAGEGDAPDQRANLPEGRIVLAQALQNETTGGGDGEVI